MSTVPLGNNKLSKNSDSIDCIPAKFIPTPPKSTISRLISAVVGGAAKLCGQVCESQTVGGYSEKHSMTVSKVEKSPTNATSTQSSVTSSITNDGLSVTESRGKFGARQCPFYKRIPSTYEFNWLSSCYWLTCG